MTTVAAVRLRYNPKSYWFDPAGASLSKGDQVLVETERGREVGHVIEPHIEATKGQIDELKSPLKPIVRILDESDNQRIGELDSKGREAMPVFREYIEKHKLDMQPVEVEFLFSGDKVVFYFTSENRVDFRDLVRDLAAYYHMRIDMRQIGARDEARMIGGLAHCGEVLCCTRIGAEFDSVSIRMAKEQDLSLNPAKISGVCGRLMCCLRYEYEAYKDFKQRAPKKGTLVETPLGSAKVTGLDTPREVIHMRFDDGKELSVPFGSLECDRDKNGCISCCRASRDVIDECATSSILLALMAIDRELEQKEDLLDERMEPLVVRQQTRRRRRGGQEAAERRPRGEQERPAGRTASSRVASGQAPASAGAAGGMASDADGSSSGAQQRSGRRLRNRSRRKPQDVNGEQAATPSQQQSAQQQSQSQQTRRQSQQARQQSTRRQARQPQKSGEKPQGRREQQSQQQPATHDRPRPGQKSSGLRNPAPAPQPEQRGEQESSPGRRRRRRRSEGPNRSSSQDGGSEK